MAGILGRCRAQWALAADVPTRTRSPGHESPAWLDGERGNAQAPSNAEVKG